MTMKVRVLREGFIPADHEAALELQTGNAALLRFLQPFDVDGEIIEYAVAQTRLEGTSFDDLKKGRMVPCGLTAQPREKAISSNPLDLSWWRGGKAAITDLVPL